MEDESLQEGNPASVISDLFSRAVGLHQDGRLEEALDIYGEILALSPHHFDAMHLSGVIALQQGRYSVAQQVIYQALAVNPRDAPAMGNLGTSYMRDGQIELALHWFELALRLEPASAVALTNCAAALHNMGRYREALPLLRSARTIDSNSYEVCNLLGASLLNIGELHEAVEYLTAATRSRPEEAEGWANLSVALNALGDEKKARECADRANLLKPQSSAALGALAAAQLDQGRLAEAVENYRRGTRGPGPSAQMLMSFSSALLTSGLQEEAVEQLRKALALDKNNLTIRWSIAMAQLKAVYSDAADVISSRERFSESLDDVSAWYFQAADVREPFNAVGVNQPFYLAYQPFNNKDMLRRYGALCATWMRTFPASGQQEKRHLDKGVPVQHDAKLRIGIVSAQISDHSVWNAITRGWVHHFDRNRFEVELFHLGRITDAQTEDAKRLAGHFEDRPTDLGGWIEAIEKRSLDILIYPEIGMNPLTLRLAALRLAPVQAATWGHPETTGLPTIDFYVSSEDTEPDHAEANYSETLVRLPKLGVYVEPLTPQIAQPDLKLLKLPKNEPLLLCPGAPFKYSPLFDEVWVQIAAGLPKSFFRRNGVGRLVFFGSRSGTMDDILEKRLRLAFQQAGLEFDRHVSVIPYLERSQYFGLMRQSALMLDTPGFSGFNTALQAVECELPVLAFEGEFMRGRLASAIMRRLGMPELVATTKEEFIEKAVELAGDAERRQDLRRVMVARRDQIYRDKTPIRALEDHLSRAVTRAKTGSQAS